MHVGYLPQTFIYMYTNILFYYLFYFIIILYIFILCKWVLVSVHFEKGLAYLHMLDLYLYATCMQHLISNEIRPPNVVVFKSFYVL